ncbi:MAG: tetratricopeptide repeat protein [Alphaproteobacteria bacterium]|nr:tetratricopeptide repeat protein [Alphaproteobacteria bacterium]
MTKTVLINGLFSAAIALAVAAGPLSVAFAPATALAQERVDPPKPKTQKVQAMTKPTFEALTNAQKQIETKAYAEALVTLQGIEANQKINEYERASIYQTFAYLYAEQEKYKDAIVYFQKSIDISKPAEGLGLPQAQVTSTMYNLGQLYMVVEDYKQAVIQLEAWRKVAESVNSQGLAMLATAYYQNENFDKALELIKEAIAKTTEPKEQWYQLQLAILLERDRYPEAEKLLELMIPKFPGNRTYWMQLAAVYNELNKDKESFAIFAAAYQLGFLTDEKDIVRLARLYMFHENPYQGAMVMEKAFKGTGVQRNSENLEVVANAYFNAREYKKAIPWLKEAADKSPNGILEMRLCQAQLQLNAYKDAEESCKSAIDKKGLKDEGSAWMTMCVAQIEQKKWGTARQSCESASKFKDKARDADQWLKYIDQRAKEAKLVSG